MIEQEPPREVARVVVRLEGATSGVRRPLIRVWIWKILGDRVVYSLEFVDDRRLSVLQPLDVDPDPVHLRLDQVSVSGHHQVLEQPGESRLLKKLRLDL